jgi:hypothetical protein
MSRAWLKSVAATAGVAALLGGCSQPNHSQSLHPSARVTTPTTSTTPTSPATWLEGTWRTPELADSLFNGAVRRAGASRADAASIRRQHDAEAGPTDRFTLKVSGNSWAEFSRTDGGAGEVDGSHGTLDLQGNQLTLTDETSCVIHLLVTRTGAKLRFKVTGVLMPPCLPNDHYIVSAMYETAPFHRVQ